MISRSDCMCVYRSSSDSSLAELSPLSMQAGAFIPRMLEQALLLETSDDILDLNVILVYKKLVQGLIYSPPDCDKHLALDAKPQVSVAMPRDCGSATEG